MKWRQIHQHTVGYITVGSQT